MKRSLYPVVKHGARFAVISLIFIPAYSFGVGLVISKGNVLGAERAVTYLCRPGHADVLVTQVILTVVAVLLTAVWGTYGHRRRVLRLAAKQAALKLKADAAATPLATGDQGGAGQMAGSIEA